MSIQQSFTQANPAQIFRSNIFSLSTTTLFACNVTYTSVYTWQLNGADFVSNPTYHSAELVVQANTLFYGLYQFTCRVDITSDSFASLTNTLTNTVSTFISIIPTGLAVYAIQNGVSSQLIGSSQVFQLNPMAYSFDMDNLVSPISLQFQFYCKTLNSLNKNSSSSQYDLYSYKMNSSLTMTANETCFSSNSSNFHYKFIILYDSCL